jgi:transcriptional regulator with XRE-family HTH domain
MSLPRLLKDARQRRDLSVTQLAAEAGVSNGTILALENEEEFQKEIDASKDNTRKRRAIARSLARLATALSQPPHEWIDEWARFTGMKIDRSAYDEIVKGARRVLQKTSRTELAAEPGGRGDAYDWYCEHAMDTGIRIRIGILTDQGSWSKSRVDFYEAFARLIFLKLGCEPEFVSKSNLTDLYAELSVPEDTKCLRAVMGVSKTVSRRRYRVNFIPIPGLKFRLACLAREDKTDEKTSPPLTWDQVVGHASNMNSQPPLRLHVIGVRGEIGSSYLIDECGYSLTHSSSHYDLDLIDSIKVEDIVDALRAKFEEDESKEVRAKDAQAQTGEQKAAPKTTFKTVFVCGEEYAYPIKRAMSEPVRKQKAYVLKNLATEPRTYVPIYDEAIMVRDQDIRWRTLIEDAIFECFVNSADRLASMYSKYYYSVIASDYYEVQRMLKNEESFPGLYRFHGKPITQQFDELLRKYLRDELMTSGDFGERLDELIDKILPKEDINSQPGFDRRLRTRS